MCDVEEGMLKQTLYYTNGWNRISKNFSETSFAVKYYNNVHIHIHTRQKKSGGEH